MKCAFEIELARLPPEPCLGRRLTTPLDAPPLEAQAMTAREHLAEFQCLVEPSRFQSCSREGRRYQQVRSWLHADTLGQAHSKPIPRGQISSELETLYQAVDGKAVFEGRYTAVRKRPSGQRALAGAAYVRRVGAATAKQAILGKQPER